MGRPVQSQGIDGGAKFRGIAHGEVRDGAQLSAAHKSVGKAQPVVPAAVGSAEFIAVSRHTAEGHVLRRNAGNVDHIAQRLQILRQQLLYLALGILHHGFGRIQSFHCPHRRFAAVRPGGAGQPRAALRALCVPAAGQIHCQATDQVGQILPVQHHKAFALFGQDHPRSQGGQFGAGDRCLRTERALRPAAGQHPGIVEQQNGMIVFPLRHIGQMIDAVDGV